MSKKLHGKNWARSQDYKVGITFYCGRFSGYSILAMRELATKLFNTYGSKTCDVTNDDDLNDFAVDWWPPYPNQDTKEFRDLVYDLWAYMLVYNFRENPEEYDAYHEYFDNFWYVLKQCLRRCVKIVIPSFFDKYGESAFFDSLETLFWAPDQNNPKVIAYIEKQQFRRSAFKKSKKLTWYDLPIELRESLFKYLEASGHTIMAKTFNALHLFNRKVKKTGVGTINEEHTIVLSNN